ncbi:MAG: flippase-like domain-containing protein [Anaerolineae bacterium]|nr:flippase-like domain-containing protein [Anaerolineae bacterium]
MNTQSKIRPVWSWVRLVMGIVGLVALFELVDMQDVLDTLAGADLMYIFPAWVLLMAATAVKTWRWMLLLRKNHVGTTFGRLFGTYLIGAFYSQFLPGSSAGGDAMRMAESSVDTGRAVDSVSSVLIERAIGLISVVTTAALILLIVRPGGIPFEMSLLVYGLSIAGIAGLVILHFGWFVPTFVKLMTQFKMGGVARKVERLSKAFQGDLGEPRIVGEMVLLSLLANFFSMTSYYVVLLAISEPVSYLAFISIVALISTLEIIPLTPGSLGIKEGAYVFFLGYLSVSEPNALSIGLLIRFVGWTQAVLGGLILLERGMHPSQHRRSTEPSSRL